MRAESTTIRVQYIELIRDNITETPFCKDIFQYRTISPYHVQITYTLRLFDDYSEIMGEYRAECELESNQQITSYHLDRFMTDLSLDAREKFNKEAAKTDIRMFIPRPDTLQVFKEDMDAA